MRTPKTDITFTPEAGEILAHFTVPQKHVQAFINHLNAQRVSVQGPQPAYDLSGVSFYFLELTSELDEATAEELISKFKPE